MAVEASWRAPTIGFAHLLFTTPLDPIGHGSIRPYTTDLNLPLTMILAVLSMLHLLVTTSLNLTLRRTRDLRFSDYHLPDYQPPAFSPPYPGHAQSPAVDSRKAKPDEAILRGFSISSHCFPSRLRLRLSHCHCLRPLRRYAEARLTARSRRMESDDSQAGFDIVAAENEERG